MISNTPAPEVWVLSSIIFQEKSGAEAAKYVSKFKLVKNSNYLKKIVCNMRFEVPESVIMWLWAISHNVSPVILWIGEDYLPGVSVPEMSLRQLKYVTFRDALISLRVSPIASEIIVDRQDLVTDNVVMYNGSASRYGGKKWTLREA